MNPLIIGAGHNGLTAAFYLAKAGLKPLLLEQSDAIGGGAVTGELHPGFRCPTLSHYVSLRSDIAADMQLARQGLEFLESPVEVFAPTIDGPPVVIYRNTLRTTDALRRLNAADAKKYATYRSSVEDVCAVLSSILAAPAPDIDEPDVQDVWNLLKTGRRFRALGAKKAYAFLRWAPMPVADFACEWFESDVLRAVVAAPGLSGTMLGPRSAGSTLVLMLNEATRRLADGGSRVRGGPGALTRAMAEAARTEGADIRIGTRVERVLVRNGRVAGVVAGGQEIPAAVVVSAIDPKTTFLELVDPADLSPDLLLKVRGYRASGTLAKVNLALSGLPVFTGPTSMGPDRAGHDLHEGSTAIGRHARHAGDLPDGAELLAGRIHIGPDLDYLERAFDHAKYGELSDEPWLDITIPSVLDPALAPSGAHVVSIYAHYAPYRLRSDVRLTFDSAQVIPSRGRGMKPDTNDGKVQSGWPEMKDTLLKRVMSILERFAPGVGKLVLAAEVITPLELETRYGFHGGHIFHGELALDQLATMRPLLGYSRYRSPIPGLFLCGAGTHPGGFMSGGSGQLAAREIAKSLRLD